MKVLVTGGTGYIGSHTIVDLDENGFDVVSIDNGTRSRTATIDAINKITKHKIDNKDFDLCDKASLFSFFEQQTDIQGIIHFAAYKSVPESVENPLLYYRNNLESLMNLLEACKQFSIPYFVFSSSCSVYGNVEQLPVTESAPMQKAESPYAHTKQIGEAIITDFAKICPTQFVLLRYFNPVGAHSSNFIGENPLGIVYNVVPRITGTAIGKFEKLMVFGHDYPTRDGTCIRDYIHVMDIANAHTKAIQFLQEKQNKQQVEIFNLGTGNGVTVLEAIQSFERVSGKKLNYELVGRREGDVVSIYANNDKAIRALNWKIRYGIDDMMRTAWDWEQHMSRV
jgi:UDP-glucose 4-epimerase